MASPQRLRSDRARSSCRCHRHSPLPTSARSCSSAALAGSRFPKAAMHGARVVRRTRMGPGQTSPSTRRRSAERRPHGGSPRAWILEAAARQHMKRCVRPSASWGHGHVGRCGGGTSATRNITSGGSRAGSWRAPRVSCRTQTVGAGRPRSCTVAQASRVVRFASARRVASLRMHEKMHCMQNDGRPQVPGKGEHLTHAG
jgi:hypothetical protein